MPVVIPSAASMDTVKLVANRAWFSFTISGRRNCRQRSRVSGRQIRPRPKRAMKLMSSGRTLEAAMTRSPSFSRSSSSISTTMRPARMSSSNSGIVFNCGFLVIGSFPNGGGGHAVNGVIVKRLRQALEVARDQVDLQVDGISGLQSRQAS